MRLGLRLLLLGGCLGACNDGGPGVTNLTGNNTFLADPSNSEPDAMPDPTDGGTDTGSTAAETSGVSATEPPPTTGPDDTSTSSAPSSDPDTTAPSSDPDTTAPSSDPDTTDPSSDPDTTDPTNDPDTTDPTNDPDTTDPTNDTTTGDPPGTLEEALQDWCAKFVMCFPGDPYSTTAECVASEGDAVDSLVSSASDMAACRGALLDFFVCLEADLCSNGADCDTSQWEFSCS